MKSLKIIAMGSMALAAASMASAAATFVKITGSTAFRKATIQAIINSLSDPEGAYTDAGKGIDGSNRAIIHGHLKSTNDEVYFQAAWAGSVGGVRTLVGDLTVPPNSGWTDTTTWLTTGTTLTSLSVNSSTHVATGGTDLSATGTTVYGSAATADISMSDSFQSSTIYTDPALNDTIVGVVGFTWAKGAKNTGGVPEAAWDRFTNITPQVAQALMTNGVVPLSMLTGDSSDDAYDVVLTGRDNDSGTRLTAFAETGFGVGSSPVQYSVNNTTGALDVFQPSDNGYASGGSVKSALQAAIPSDAVSPNGLPYILVSYVGISDTPGTEQQLTYNGVAYGTTAIQEGQYSFWGYEHMLWRDSLSDTVTLQAASDVIAQIGAGDALASGLKYDDGAGVDPGTLRVTRVTDGGVIISNIR